ncbi:hypothetical protein C8T65DRAFT_561533, partial [Cerioporus squamosus]
GSRLRYLFTTILLHCNPAAPHELWQEFRAGICDDLRHRLNMLGYLNATDEEIYDYGL